MKTMSVRFTELEQKRLSDLAIKRGGTMSDTVREIIGKYFEDHGKAEADKAEHEKTRARFSDLDNALAHQVNDLSAIKTAVEQFAIALTEMAARVGEAKK